MPADRDRQVQLESLKSALHFLHNLDRLRLNELASYHMVKNQTLCKLEHCNHTHAGECLAETIRHLIEERIQNFEDNDDIWQGCVLLWLCRVYPANRNTIRVGFNVLNHVDMTSEDEKKEQQVKVLKNAFHEIGKILKGRELKSLFPGWPPSPSTIYKKVEMAREWLLDRMQGNFPGQIAWTACQNLAKRYGYFELPNGECVPFEGSSVTPDLHLQSRAGQERYRLKDILAGARGKIYIYGSPASGKTVMSRFAVWYIAQMYPQSLTNAEEFKNSQFPLAFDCGLVGWYRSSHDKSFVELFIDQLERDQLKKDRPQTDKLEDKLSRSELHDLSHSLVSGELPPIPILDNWDCLSLDSSLRLWQHKASVQLREYPKYLIFSRNPEPWPPFDGEIYELAELSDLQITTFINQWLRQTDRVLKGRRLKWENLWAGLQSADQSVRDMSRMPFTLALLCEYFFENEGKFPQSYAQMMRQITWTLLSKESEKLRLPHGDLQKILDVLEEIAWYTYVRTNKPRDQVLDEVDIRKARGLFSDKEERSLFDELCNSLFFTIKETRNSTLIRFPSSAYRDFYTAEKLMSLGDKAKQILGETIQRMDWENVRSLYSQLLSAEEKQ